VGIRKLEKFRVKLFQNMTSTVSGMSRLWQIDILLGNYFCSAVTNVARY